MFCTWFACIISSLTHEIFIHCVRHGMATNYIWFRESSFSRGRRISHNLSASLTSEAICSCSFAISTHLCTSLWFSSCSGLLAHPLSAHSAMERRPYPSQKLSPLSAMIPARPPTGAPPTPLTATGDTASSTSTRASIATSRSRGRSTRTCRRVRRDKVAKIFMLKIKLTSIELKMDKVSGMNGKLRTHSVSRLITSLGTRTTQHKLVMMGLLNFQELESRLLSGSQSRSLSLRSWSL